MKHVVIGDIPTAIASRQDLVEELVRDCRAHRATQGRRARLVFDSNGQALSLYARNDAYRAAIDGADIVHADGAFIVMASSLMTRAPIPQRSATTDFIHDVAERCAKETLSFYLLGATEEVNRLCAEELRRLYPGLQIAGRHNGYFSEDEEGSILADIERARPDVLWIGLGKPREQIFANRHRRRLSAVWVVTAGGCFNFITGHYKRAPLWMQNIGLEWLHRMITGPAGLFRRYVTTIPHALWLTATRTRRDAIDKPFP